MKQITFIILGLMLSFGFIQAQENDLLIQKQTRHMQEQLKIKLQHEQLNNKDFFLEKQTLEERKLLIKKRIVNTVESETISTKSTTGISQTEFDALVALYNATDGDNWTDNTGWDINGSPADVDDSWFGITVSGGAVTQIDLSENNLIGTIPTEIGNLTNLQVLSLYSNQLSGNIPTGIGNLVNLIYLDFESNALTGNIPSEIENLTNLYYLFLDSNQFTNLPDLSTLTNLDYLYIQNNQFEFDDLETANVTWANIANHVYSPQANIALGRTDNAGTVTFTVTTGGSNNNYKWFNDGEEITGETSTSLTINDTEAGIFYAEITNTDFPELALTTNSEAVNIATNHGVTQTEYDALIAFYNSTNGASWTDNTNWLTSEDVENWKGVTVANYHVTKLYLYSNNLTGNIPTEIGNLANLTNLSLSSNQLTGNIPTEIGNLTNLQDLWLYDNELTGNIPTEIGNLANLTALVLRSNQLTGNIPTEIGNLTNLNSLSVRNNQLTGSIPAEIGNLTNLRYLYLYGNQFTDLPDLSALTNLDYLYIQDNQFEFDDLETANVTWANITNHDYSPQANITLGRTDNAGSVTLSCSTGGSNNNYKWFNDGEEITGETSASLTINDTEAGIFYCEITNTDYPELTLTTNSEAVNIAINHGVTQTEYDALVAFYNSTNGASWTDNTNWLTEEDVVNWKGITVENYHVTKIKLGNNNLTGTLPAEIGDLTYLINLQLWTNEISGNLPVEIGNLVNLTYLDLAPNAFTGTIPSEIGNLTKLTTLWLNDSEFTGTIPSEIGNLTNLQNLYLQGNQLSGAVPSEIGNLINLELLQIYGNQLTDLPDLSALTTLDNLYINDNQFEFDDLETANVSWSNISNYRYSPQAQITLGRTDNSGTITFTVTTGGINNSYRWFNDGTEITGETGTSLTINDTEDGIFYCEVTNTDYPELALTTNSEAVNIATNHGVTQTEYDALVALYNSTDGDNWTDNTNWLTEEDVVNWKGITVENCHIIGIFLGDNNLTGSIPTEIGNLTNLHYLGLHNNQLTGNVPTEIGNLTYLQYLVLSNNQFTNLPDLTALTNLTDLYIENNQFEFDDIEPNLNVASDYFSYTPQALVGNVQEYSLNSGDNQTISVNVGGANNTYQWYKDDSIISGATNPDYTITSFSASDAGVYTCKINNTLATDLELTSNNITVTDAATSLSSIIKQSVEIYPNPTNGILILKITDNSVNKISVTNLSGKVLSEFITNTNTSQIDISGYPNGIYFITVENKQGRNTAKVIKQ